MGALGMLLAGTLLGAAVFRLRGWSGFERITGRGATTARLVWGAAMGLLAWAAGARWDMAVMTGIGMFLGCLPPWWRSLSMGENPADGPVWGQYLRHFARGLLWPLPAAVLPWLYHACGAIFLGWPLWTTLEDYLPSIIVAATGLACVPAYHLGKKIRPDLTTSEWFFGGAMGAGVAARAFLGLALLVALVGPAGAHQAPAGWDYDRDCCHNFDCAPVPDGTVREVAGGYEVVLRPGQHPMLREGVEVRVFVPHGDRRIRVSGDSDRHACVSAYGTLFCIYIPPGGV